MINSFRDQYAFLSNFYHSPFKVGYNIFRTVEHYYQYYKCEIMDYEYKAAILNAATPLKAKHIGNRVKLRSNWNEIKDKIMLNAVTAKFSQNPHLKLRLIDTGDEELIEGNNWGDTYWGMCNGEGLNKLGKILMEVRALAKKENNDITHKE